MNIHQPAKCLPHVLCAVEAARLGTFDVDIQTGLVALSPRARQYLGLPEGDNCQITREELRACIVRDDLCAIDAVLEAALQRPDGSFHIEARVVPADGTVRCLAFQGAYLFERDESGRRSARRMAGVVRETSDQQLFHRRGVDRPRVPLAMHEVDEITAIAMRAAHIGIYEWNPQTDEAVWSDEMRALFGVGAGEDVNLSKALACLYPEDFERVRQALAAAMDPDGDGQFEVEHRVHVRGDVRWVQSIGRFRFEEHDGVRVPVRMAGLAIDVTSRKNLESALREANRRKDEFMAMLGHELRNPLAPLRTASELMRSGQLEPHQLYAMQEMIARQVGHMTRLVDDLLDTARIGQGKLSLNRAPLELRSLLAAAIETARSFTETRRLTVELDAPREPLWVDGDPVRLTQVVSNLLHNSSKFSDEGATIRIALARDGAQACICVSDHGKGITAELLPRVFELFSQGDAADGHEKGGLGLGLALVRNLVRLHGGSVVASSDGPGKGSEFTVRLPLIPAPQRTAAAKPAFPGGLRAGRRVLVVDDNADAAETLKMLLELSGQVVDVAADGAQAIARFDAQRPDVVLVDIGLPDMDGYEVARRLRARPACGGVALAALTGYGGPEDRKRSLEAGFDRHLVKPVVPEELFDLLRALPAAAPAAAPQSSTIRTM